MAFLNRLNSGDLLRATKALHRVVKKEIASAPNVNIEKLERAGASHQVAVDEYLGYLYPACRWMSVMLVSFIEFYLEEALISIAVKNPLLVKDADIEKSRIFEVDSIEQLRSEMRLNWAHNALRPGGPETWRKKLRQLGAPRFDDNSLRKLQHLWDTRNLIVHSQCVASTAYVKKYPYMGVKVGEKVHVNLGIFKNWLSPTKAFIEWSDRFFLAYGSEPKKGTPGGASTS
jgi:hypothetical protein